MGDISAVADGGGSRGDVTGSIEGPRMRTSKPAASVPAGTLLISGFSEVLAGGHMTGVR